MRTLISFRGIPLALVIAFLVWSMNTETCNARRGKHWRQSSELYKKKGKNHGGSQHHKNGSKSKHKAPSPKLAPPVLPPVPEPRYKPSPNLAPPVIPPVLPPVPEPRDKLYPKLAPPVIPPVLPPAPEPRDKVPAAPPTEGTSTSPASTYNVLNFGAKGDGITDDTKAFEAAWATACKVEASEILVPSDYKFLVGPISFSGPYCQHNIIFQLDGTIIAPTSFDKWGSGLYQWLLFTKLVGISIQGKGIIDGRGSIWWQASTLDDLIDDELKLIVPFNNTGKENPHTPIITSLGGKMPSIKPTALRFYGSFNVTVTGITIQNSPQCHLKFDNCIGVSVNNINVSSPADSPNTDGIHLQNSKDVLIHTTDLACGDDCISIQTGCTNVYVHNVNCGPGHGISIGSLGRFNTKACVSNITVKDVVMHNTMNGVRIKTWQGGSGSVQGVLFSNIQVSEVQLPVVIDQFYCDKSTCKNQTSAVALSGITYERIRGTYTVKPVHFACSDSQPCTDVTLNGIDLKPVQERYHMYDPFCWQTFGELYTPPVPPINCLQLGKPSSNHIQADHDTC